MLNDGAGFSTGDVRSHLDRVDKDRRVTNRFDTVFAQRHVQDQGLEWPRSEAGQVIQVEIEDKVTQAVDDETAVVALPAL